MSRTGMRAAGPQDRAVGQELAEERRTARPRTARRALGDPGQPAAQRAVGGAVGRQPAVAASALGRRRAQAAAATAAAPPARGHRRARARRAASAWTNVAGRIAPARASRRRRRRRRAPGGAPRAAPGAAWTSGIAPKRSDELRQVRVAPRSRAASEHGRRGRATRDRSCGAAADQRERVGHDRVAGRGGEARQGRRERRVVLRSGDDRARARRRPDAGGQVGDLGRRERRAGPASTRGRRLVSAARGPSGPSGTSGSRNGSVEVDRARRARERPSRPPGPRRRGRGAASRPPPSSSGSSANHFAWRPEEADLVDRLGRAPVAQLGRPVGRQEDQRHAPERRLDDGRQEVGRGGARGRQRRRPGRRAAFASPRAKKPALRSSRSTRTRMPGCARRASASGVEREPGQTTASRSPPATSSSTKPRSAGQVGHRAVLQRARGPRRPGAA